MQAWEQQEPWRILRSVSNDPHSFFSSPVISTERMFATPSLTPSVTSPAWTAENIARTVKWGIVDDMSDRNIVHIRPRQKSGHILAARVGSNGVCDKITGWRIMQRQVSGAAKVLLVATTAARSKRHWCVVRWRARWCGGEVTARTHSLSLTHTRTHAHHTRTHTHTHTHNTHMHAHTCTDTHTHTHTHTYVRTHTHTHTHHTHTLTHTLHTHSRTRTHTPHTRTRTHIHTLTHSRTHAFTHSFTLTHSHTHAHHTHAHAHTHTHSCTYTHARTHTTHTHTHTQVP